MVNRLNQAAGELFGKGAPSGSGGDESKKKNQSQFAGGTTPNGNTSSSDRPAGVSAPGFRDDTIGRSGASTGDAGGTGGSAGEVDERAAGGKAGPAEAGSATGTGESVGGVGDGEEETGSETLDALALLNKGLPQPEALKDKDESVSADGDAAPKSGTGKPKTEGSALRTQLEKTLAANRDLEKRLKEIESREDPRVKEITTAWEAEKKARAEAEARIAHLDYSQSAEFRERFVAPYEQAATDTLRQLRGLTADDGTKLSQQELETILVGGEEEAYQLIDSKFSGAKATMATGWVKDVYSLDRVRYRALESAKGMALERQKQTSAQQKAREEQVKMLWEKERDSRMASAKDLFERSNSDKKRSKLLDEGAILADAAFFRPSNVSDEQAIAIMAEVRNRAAALPALKEAFARERARADALEAELKKYRGHEPGNGEPGEDTSTAKSKFKEGTMEFAIEQLRELAS